MHPPLKIIDQTDEMIAIEWLREHGYSDYAEHMEAAMEMHDISMHLPKIVWADMTRESMSSCAIITMSSSYSSSRRNCRGLWSYVGARRSSRVIWSMTNNSFSSSSGCRTRSFQNHSTNDRD